MDTKRLIRSAVVLAFVAVAIGADAQQVSVGRLPGIFEWRGEITAKGIADLTHLAGDNATGTLRFIESNGGELAFRKALVEAVRSMNLTVEVAGPCHSACAYVFLSTTRRRFAADYSGEIPPFIHIHGIYSVATRELSEIGKLDEDFYFISTRGKMPRQLISEALATKNSSGGLYVYAKPPPFARDGETVALCKDEGEKIKCALFLDFNPKTIGVIE